MRDIIGYEEKQAETLRHLTSGYPRFVLHPLVRQLTQLFVDELGLTEQTLWLACSARMADDLAAELGSAHALRVRHDGLHGVAHPTQPSLASRAKLYLQNTGGFLSSREAEDHLLRRGLLAQRHEEVTVSSGELGRVTQAVVAAFPGTTARDVVLAPSGMNAFHAAWRTVAELQATRGRTVWLQLGWLYLDTIALLKRFTSRPGDYIHLRSVTDLAAVEAACAAAGDRLAGLVTEAPTNPLVQTADLAAVARCVQNAGGRLIVDPTLVSPLNIRVLEHADVVVTSLTKYAANEGDVIAGAAIINPAGADADHLRAHVARRADPIYRRDLARLAAQIEGQAALVARTNASVPQIVAFLEQHPQVKRVYWSLQACSRDNYLKLAASPAHVGAMISFTLHRPLAEFYDRVRLAKGPSFGMQTTLLCPFIYLAHYDLVTSEEGRAELAASGIEPELLRLAVGPEPVEELIAALAEALD